MDRSQDKPEKQKFRLDKSISISNIVAVLTLVAPVFGWVVHIDKQQELLALRMDFANKAAEETRERIKDSLHEINGKLERLVSTSPRTRQ
jgi:hypothetical protein